MEQYNFNVQSGKYGLTLHYILTYFKWHIYDTLVLVYHCKGLNIVVLSNKQVFLCL